MSPEEQQGEVAKAKWQMRQMSDRMIRSLLKEKKQQMLCREVKVGV